MGRLCNTLLDNSPAFRMAAVLRGLSLDPGYTAALINTIVKTKPNTELPLLEADIANWSKFVHTETNAGEEGIVSLAMQCIAGSGND
jgi:hypothetical protein